VHDEVHFSLIHGDKKLLAASPSFGRAKRMAEVLNLDPKHLLETQQHFPEHDTAVQLILGDINIKRTRRDMQFIFVNGRPVQNKAIAFHINQTYRLIMPPDLSPCFAVFLTVPPQNVDVNIHPTKREVKIKNEQDICAVLRSLCEQTLMSSGPVQQAIRGPSGLPSYGSRSDLPLDAPSLPGSQETFFSSEEYAYPRSSAGAEVQNFFPPETGLSALKGEDLHSRLGAARYIGNAMNKFLLYEISRSVFVIDQHAAAERITYERLTRQMEKGAVEVQHLLSPVLVRLTPQELLIWETAKDKFEALGLSVTQWDEETLAVHTYPIFMKDVEKAMRNLLAGEDLAKCDHDAMARRACRSSVMAGDKLAPEEAEHFRAQLLKCLDPFTCPHGRPTIIELTEDFLDKQFLRT
jgi:DNA mismatch repair protein MutL